MDWPHQRVEDIPPLEFVPRFCPWPECPSQREVDPLPFSYRPMKQGYTRKCDGRWVPRFVCEVCQRRFSQQTFAASYCLKRPQLLEPIARGLVAGSGHRPLGRSLDCAHSTVTRMAARLGRHALLLTARMLEHLGPLDETVCYDHFETFGVSQDFPIGVGTPVAARSWLVLGLDAAPHRRGGRLSTAQRWLRAKREQREGRPPAGAYARALRRTLDRLTALVDPSDTLRLVTDDKKTYRAVVAQHPEAARIAHTALANPPRRPKRAPRSRAARQRDLALRPVDKAHQFIRHSQAHHRRETIAFARRHAAVLENLFLHVAWLNFVKRRIENEPGSGTRAMKHGLTDGRWDWARLLARRLMPHRERLPEDWRELYFRTLSFPRIADRKPHQKVYAQ
jgi:transposase-like protein